MLIGITGLAASGKDTAAEYYKNKHWQIFSCSDILRKEIKKLNIPDTRENLITFASQMKKERGSNILIKMIISKVKGDAVILGIRHPDEIATLRQNPDFYLIAILADPKIRFQRAQLRAKPGDAIVNYKKFLKLENIELHGLQGGQNLEPVIKSADYIINNKGTKAELFNQIDKIMEKINEPRRQ